MKIKVDHTGVCMGYHFTQGVTVDVPDEIAGALGDHCEVIERSASAQRRVDAMQSTTDSYKDMQARAREAGINPNQSREKLIEALAKTKAVTSAPTDKMMHSAEVQK